MTQPPAYAIVCFSIAGGLVIGLGLWELVGLERRIIIERRSFRLAGWRTFIIKVWHSQPGFRSLVRRFLILAIALALIVGAVLTVIAQP
jgi:hypothetical protein